jgi:hypothetical protein
MRFRPLGARRLAVRLLLLLTVLAWFVGPGLLASPMRLPSIQAWLTSSMELGAWSLSPDSACGGRAGGCSAASSALGVAEGTRGWEVELLDAAASADALLVTAALALALAARSWFIQVRSSLRSQSLATVGAFVFSCGDHVSHRLQRLEGSGSSLKSRHSLFHSSGHSFIVWIRLRGPGGWDAELSWLGSSMLESTSSAAVRLPVTLALSSSMGTG